MRTRIHKLCHEGDIIIQWDTESPEEIAKARQAVLDLKNQGYEFFLADGSPAPDEVSAGGGSLTVRRITVHEVLSPPVTNSASITEQLEGHSVALANEKSWADNLPKTRRGRAPKAAANTTAQPPQERVVVAARANRGG